VLDAMRREVTVNEVQAAPHLAQKRGIEVGMFIMLGFEGELQSDLSATVDHLKKGNPYVFLTTVSYPIKGTPYHKQVQDGVLAAGAWEQWSDRTLSVKRPQVTQGLLICDTLDGRLGCAAPAIERPQLQPRAHCQGCCQSGGWPPRYGAHITPGSIMQRLSYRQKAGRHE
jgi:hypothetical protein